MIPIAYMAPSAVSLYWTTSAVAALGVNLVIMSPKVRKAMRIPPLPTETAHPYKQAWDTMVHKKVNFFSGKRQTKKPKKGLGGRPR